jgi:hypothetical protein
MLLLHYQFYLNTVYVRGVFIRFNIDAFSINKKILRVQLLVIDSQIDNGLLLRFKLNEK